MRACAKVSGMQRERTAVLDIPFSYVFAPFLLFAVMTLLRYAIKFARLCGRNWRTQL